jgi:amino acid adenylation domain-containing protein
VNSFVEFPIGEIERSIAERFEKQVSKNPHWIAVQTDAVQLTYEDLNKSANRLARLFSEDCRDDKPIAILIEHDAPAVIAIFGALKASKIFLLLDPALPEARIEQILDDSGSNFIVTNDQNLGVAKALLERGRRLVNIDHCEVVLNSNNVNLAIRPDNISYILYTSGSTGRPKGVIRTHRNDLHNIRNRTNSFRIDAGDKISLLGSFSTGQGMTDIYSALLNGATLLPRNLKREGLTGLAEWLMHERMTIYHSSATFFRHFAGELRSELIFPEVRIVNVGGEPVTWKDVELYKKHFSDDCVFVNELSCSEASTFGQFFVNKETAINSTVPVGYPVEDKDVLILDRKGDPLRTGDIGEIAICSQFLSPGYWNQPDLTKLVFGPDRESQTRRIYRTGDLGRKSADGCLEYLGRKDARVKIRGYRVECYEIELALLQIPAVDQAFVTHRQDTGDETHLIAYVVCAKGTTLTVRELRADLVTRLPEYMVPTAFVFIDTLPLTATGKLDRRVLPEPSTVRPPLDVPFVTPRDSIEQSVAELCSQILRVSSIGVHDNLFDLGGNSLMAMQIIARVMKTFRVNVPLKHFYESPTIAALSGMIVTSRGSAGTSENTEISADPREGHLPLSYFQERLWFMEQWEPGKPTYNISQAYHLAGPVNVLAMEESLNTVVDRHDILRTSFGPVEDQPSQIIASVLRLPLPIIDLRTVPEAAKNTTSLHLAQDEVRRPFDLAQSPLLRALLVQLADEEFLLLLTVHQMVCDGWSIRILLSEFWTSYEAICRDKSPSLPTLFAQYSDFAIWQRQLLNDEWFQPQIAFWQETLKGGLPVLALSTDYPRPAVESFRGSRSLFALPESLTKSLKELARQEEVTLFMTLMAAFKTLLYRYTGQQDSIVGFPIANRHWGEAAGLIGFFVNTLVARTFISGELTFKEFLYSVRDVCHAAYAHQDLPFEKLVEVLQPLRDLSRNPIYQAMFTFQNMPLINSVPPELRSSPISIDNGTSKVDLTLSLAERDSRLTGFFEYSTDLFNRARIERMAGHFQTLLETIVANPDQPVGTLPILTDAERRQILVEWNDTGADYPKDKCIQQLFEEQVKRTPDAIALEFEDKQITYRELNHRTNQLAHYLISLGIGREKLVGICVERSMEMVIGLLAILKAAGAYVPLDPAYPRERLRFMLEDANISVLVTQENLLERIQHAGLSTQHLDVCFDRDAPNIEKQSRENPSTKIRSHNLAYIIYTSGSTGNPKGVQIEHRSVVNCLTSIAEQIELKPQDAWLAVTTISFDIATLELFLPLITGAKLVLANTEESGDATRLVARLKTSQANVMQATPSMWQLLFETGWQCPAEFTILSGGEALARPLANRFLAGTDSVWNLYGPTESTIWSTMARVTANENAVSIGRPVDNTQIYILDAHLQPVPIGIPGEIYIGGDGLARGYLNRPELTAEKFIHNPFSHDATSRLYRTGDLAKYRADNNIEFLGRNDNQVKIRGHRIELGEVESILNQHPSVKESVIVARVCYSSEEKELAAYVVSGHELAPTAAELRRFLQEKLSQFMIPSVFIFLDALLLTPHGKIDRHALLRRNGERPSVDEGFVEPRTEIEELVGQVWCEVLKRVRIGVYDNFFELGGHSLLATRVVARLQNNFHVDLALRKLFEFPTVAELAHHIETLRRSSAGTAVAPIALISRDHSLPLSFSQRRLWYLQKVEPNLTAYNIPAAFRIRGDLNHAALEEALNDVLERHEVLRSYTKEIDGQPHQENVSGLRISLPMIDLTDLPREEAEAVANRRWDADARQLYDLGIAPLIRAALLKLATGEHVLMLNFHHIIADGSSLAIFYRELALFYEAACEGRKASLSPLPVQYSDFAAWQQEWLKSEAFDIQIAYWKRQLVNLPPPVEVPTDFARPSYVSRIGARLTRQLSEASTTALKAFSRQHGATTFMALFTAFNALLSRLTCREDIIVGSTVAGRNRPETEGLIGFFINALPLRTDLSGDPSFKVLLERVREVCLDAYTHQEMPFEKIVEELRPFRDPGHNPIFDILFNVADTSERALTLTGCEVSKLPQSNPDAKFDLVIHAPEIDGNIELAIVYNSALFREVRIALLLEQWANLLAQAVSSPELPISRLSLVTWNSKVLLPDPAAMLDDKWEGAIHEMLAQHARQSPDELALVDPNQSWSYRDLDEGADRLANALIAAGIKPKDRIAIYGERNSSLVVAMFGILKSGAAFLILDPAYPSARVIDYLRIAQPKGWLQLTSSSALSQDLLNYLETSDLCCRMTIAGTKNELLQLLPAITDNNPAIRIDADDPAYIAFTSGSTGEPKAVLCRHGPITHFLPWQQEAFRLTENDRFAMLSGLAYSHLHRDVFTAIYLGATIYIPSPSEARLPDQLAKWLERNTITVLHLTPALGRLLLTGAEARLPSVRRVFFGGDVLKLDEVARIRELASSAIVASFYGATETQRAVGYYETTDNAILNNRALNRIVPLGRGIKDVQLLVLNKSGHLAGIGELGELFVRSPHLAEGYMGDEERTRQMFIVNPFTNDPADRLYRTGEFGRYSPDGNVEWAGRNDRRVNIRGYRVELEEIEAILKRHPTVKSAAVVLQEFKEESYTKSKIEMETTKSGDSDSANQKSKIENQKYDSRLVAYIATDEEPQSLEDLLHSYLSARLADYMVPAHFVMLTSLPLSPNGKIDYRALPPFEFSLAAISTAPRNHIELKLQAIFAEVLGRSDIGIDDNFFRVGGHSLLAARAAVRISDAFGVNVALSAFLETPTISALAIKIASVFSPRQTSAESYKDEREEFEL